MITNRLQISTALKKYIPEEFVSYVVDLMFSEKVRFKISKPRKTKLGDYRPPINKGVHQISVNGDLNPYSFLITTIHEFAHLKTYIKFGANVKSHGVEWKSEFKKLLLPVLEKKTLPREIEAALEKSLHNLAASSCTDLQLSRALKRYDKTESSLVLLEEIGNDNSFQIGEKILKRGVLRRKRYICTEINTGKKYLVHRLAEVVPLIENN